MNVEAYLSQMRRGPPQRSLVIGIIKLGACFYHGYRELRGHVMATSTAIALAKWTVDDYHQMIAAGILSDHPVELLNGVIIEMSPEGEHPSRPRLSV